MADTDRPSRKGIKRMEQYEPDRLSPAQVAAVRRSFRNGRAALTRDRKSVV